jgi:hypothetical protein
MIIAMLGALTGALILNVKFQQYQYNRRPIVLRLEGWKAGRRQSQRNL